MSYPKLPPRRTLPPDVRERMRRRVLEVDGGSTDFDSGWLSTDAVLAGADVPGRLDLAEHPIRSFDSGGSAGADATAGAVSVDAVSGGAVPGGARVRGGRALRGPVAAAAGLALLVAGGAVVVRVSQYADSTAIAPSVTTTLRVAPGFAAPSEVTVVPTTEDDEARCDLGAPAFTVRLPGRRVLIAAGGRFCELTYTTVATSKSLVPEVPVGAAKIVWHSPTGVVVGRVPPDGQRVVVQEQYRPNPSVLSHQGFFVTLASGSTIAFDVGFPGRPATESRSVDLRTVPVAADVVDRFPSGKTDPREPANTLARCLDLGMRTSARLIDDSGRWQSGASVGVESAGGVAALRGPDGATAYCMVSEFRATAVQSFPVVEDTYRKPVRLLASKVSDAGGSLGIVARLAGAVRDDVARVELQRPQGNAVSVEVRRGTFAGALANLPSAEGTVLNDVEVRAFGRDDQLLYQGPLV